MNSLRRSNSFRTLQPFIRSRSAWLQSRVFTQQAQLLRISKSPLRPQLPFLHTQLPHNGIVHTRLTRFLTTERRQAWRYNFRMIVYGFLLFVGIRICVWTISIGLEQSRWERQHPEPPDFSWLSKWWYRTAKGRANPGDTNAFIAWLDVGDAWRKLISRLEDPTVDGAGVKPRLGEGEELSVAGVGKTGLDITAKSETWRRGYYEALMGAAKTAENLDTWVKDVTRNLAFPPEVVIGPSNPRPKPVPYGFEEAPRQENCEPAFDEPQTYYMRILTTEGFTSRQRIDAALAYGDFLRFKGLVSSAGDMYDWALDIATPDTRPNVINKATGIIADDASGISENVILATSALGTHKAQIGDLPAALSIFLSVLRALRSLPDADPMAFTRTSPIRKPSTTWYGQVNDLFLAPPYPEAPPTGDEPATRLPSAICNEAATMAHIGEILYASSSSAAQRADKSATPSQEAGLAWTRDAFDLAEVTIQSLSRGNFRNRLVDGPNQTHILLGDSVAEEEAKTLCVECLGMAMKNWKSMINVLLVGEYEQNLLNKELKQNSKQGWGFFRSPPTQTEKWRREAGIVAAREQEMYKLLRSEGLRVKEL